MKWWVVGLFVSSLLAAFGQTKGQQCHAKGGVCVDAEDVEDSCSLLPYECGSTSVCCKKGKLSQKGQSIKRKCRKTTKKCAKRGGKCVVRSGNDCSTETIDELCKGHSCTCCIGDVPPTDRPECKCGKGNPKRLIDGKEVEPQNKYPWIVGLRYENERRFICGGSIINDRYILTAANCLFLPVTFQCRRKDQITVRIADHNSISSADDVSGVTRTLEIDDYIVHPNYIVGDEVGENDIALLKLKQPLDLTANKEVRSVCLPEDASENYADNAAIATGWGRKNLEIPGSTSNVLRDVTILILKPDCWESLAELGLSHKAILCTGYPDEQEQKDLAIGDSGGPLLVNKGNSYTIVGISSFGKSKENNTVPSYFARVTRHLKWIKKQTKDGNC